MSTGKFLTGFLVGATIGGVIGLLLAPQSGEETREMILDSSEELCETQKKSKRSSTQSWFGYFRHSEKRWWAFR